MRPLDVVLAAILVLVQTTRVGAASPDVLVDTCGQVVPPRARAYLAADLDCSGYTDGDALTLGKKTTLDLGGYTFATGQSGGISCNDGRCVVRNGTVTGNATFGIVAVKSLIENMVLAHGGLGEVSLHGGTIRGTTITGTAKMGVHGNGGTKVKIVGSTISGHDRFGIWVPHVQLVDSTVTGNLTNPECSTGATCADVMSAKRPRLTNSTCGRSQTLPENPFPACLGWCVCTDD